MLQIMKSCIFRHTRVNPLSHGTDRIYAHAHAHAHLCTRGGVEMSAADPQGSPRQARVAAVHVNHQEPRARQRYFL